MKNKHLIIAAVAIMLASLTFYYYRYVSVVTTYYHATYIKPTEFERINGINGLKNFNVKTLDYSNDSSAVQTERAKTLRLIQIASDREDAAKDLHPSSMRDSIQMADEHTAHWQILSESHAVIAVDHVRNYDTGELFRKIKSFGIQSDIVQRFIEENKLSVRIYQLN